MGKWLLGIGSVGCTRHPSKKYIPDKGSRSAPQSAQYAPCTILKAGIHMWERACDQLRRHTGRLPGTGDSGLESICVQLPALP